MAHGRRSPQHRAPLSSISSPSTTRRKTLRRAPSRLQHSLASPTNFASSPVPHPNRPVLVPLQSNLRRLPSRILHPNVDKNFGQSMRESGHVTTGSKRKRVVSSNENAHVHGRSTRGSGGLKRLRTASSSMRRDMEETSEESLSEGSEMEVDSGQINSSDEEGLEEGDAGEDEYADSSDDFLITSASPRSLNRLLKGRLIELYELAGLAEDAGEMKKAEIIQAIVDSRDDIASVPPSSPPRVDGASSGYSSDDGNVAGDEETDAPNPRYPSNHRPLRRRVTVHNVSEGLVRPVKSRSLSMGNLLVHEQPLLSKRKASEMDSSQSVGSIRRRPSTRSSPTTSATTSTNVQSPPATRLRSRTTSGSLVLPTPSNPSTSKGTKGKGKAKQVEFSNDVEVHLQTPVKRNSKGKRKEASHDSGSDLTPLEDLERPALIDPSPRRLRSKDRELERSKGKDQAEDLDSTPTAPKRYRKKKVPEEDVEVHDVNDNVEPARRLRVTPMRRAKNKLIDLKESEDNEEEGEDEEQVENEEEVAVEVDEDEDEAEEVDELVSSASITPPPESKTRRSTRRRIRPKRTKGKTAPRSEEAEEGDDEEEVEEEAEDVEEAVDEDEDEEATIAVEPRKLRNGKIVGEEEDIEMEDTEEEVEEEAEEEADEDEDTENANEEAEEDEDAENASEDIDVDAEGETEEDEGMEVEEDVDLTVATAKTLIRLRRDDLVRLCETRELDVSGTKPQLAEALLQWRDSQSNGFSSPSSTGTVRPSSNRRKRRTKHHSNTTSGTSSTVPILLRSEHVHLDEPVTPVPSKEKEADELELDLESLGLEDREIPPEKLTKLEKIGSGGFKDVYIGKFKNRKIAIAEFRGQLSAMDIKELKLLGAFNHPNIVRFLGVSIPENTKETPVMFVSELCSNGDLFDYIRNVNPPPLRKVLSMMLDIARGLEYLHTSKPSIIHRDCKSSNILITAKGAAKIADFGLAKVKQSTRSMVRSLVGTVNWQAPELWHAHPKYNHKVDVFSCAMVFWEMLQWHLPNKKFPWEGMNEHAIYEIVGAKRSRPSVSGLRKQYCPEVVDLVERMWAQEHHDRPTMTEVVETLEDLVAKY